MSLLVPFVLLAVGGVAVARAVFHHDSGADAAGILALLWSREAPMKQSDILQREKIGPERVSAALVRLENLKLVQRKWDNRACTHLVGAIKAEEGNPQ